MSDYAPDSLTSYVSGGHLVKGVDLIPSHYAPRFAPGATRDSLRFRSSMSGRSAPHLPVTARFILYNTEGTTASGPFTLVMERSIRWLEDPSRSHLD